MAAALSSGEGRSVRAYRERWQKLVKAQGEEDEDEDDEGSEDEDADGSEGAFRFLLCVRKEGADAHSQTRESISKPFSTPRLRRASKEPR